ncbi:hypothetical protein T439DRAFT_371376 [Meredithblackwellia eburnea MCA 4105]
MRLLAAYNSAVRVNPRTTQSATALVLFGAGDILSQQAIEKKGRDHDLWRTARLALYGAGIFAPLVGGWYRTLDRLRLPSRTVLVATKVGLDQFVAAPTMLAVFYSSMTVLEGGGLSDIQQKLRSSWKTTVILNWGVFIPVQALNFGVIPAHLQLLSVNVVSLFWKYVISNSFPVL